MKLKFYSFVVIAILCGLMSTVQAQKKLISLDETANGWKINTDKGSILLTPYTNNIVQVKYLPDGKETNDTSYSVVLRPNFKGRKTRKQSKAYILESGEIEIFVSAVPFHISFTYKGETISQTNGFEVSKGICSASMKLTDGEAIYGGGERAIPMNRRGYKLQLYNGPRYGYEFGADQLNYSIPLVLSSKKYAILWDNPQKGTLDIGKTKSDVLEWSAIGGTAKYFVIAQSDYTSLMKSYTELTGRQQLPPRWVLGNLQSRMAYQNQTEIDSVVTLMQKKNFPVDAVIIDFYWFGKDIQGYLGNLDWYKKAWPDPVGMIAKFKKQGVKTILITEPYVIDSLKNYKDADAHHIFVTDSAGKTFVDHKFYFGNGSLIDIFKPEARDWFWQKYKKQIDNGVAAWWGDLGEPESHPSAIRHINGTAEEVHNVFGHTWDKMLYDRYAENYPNTRLFHLQRSGFAGSQRYSAFPWTGDVSRSWGGLKAQLPLLLTMGMNGLGYIHSDAGGFAMGVKDDELYTRWLQMATFCPILRPHGSGFESEPVYFSEKTQDIVRKFMNLRYSLLPYNYTLAWQNATTGSPLMRPMFYHYAADTTAAHIGDQYTWGENILVAAVTEKGQQTKKVYLPEGEWFDFFTGKAYIGKQWIEYPLTIEQIPVFAKGGSFIPMTTAVKSIDQYHSDNFSIRYYPGESAEFTQFDDDGADKLSLQNNKFELIQYKGTKKGKTIQIEMSKKGTYPTAPTSRSITFEIRTETAPQKITLNGKTLGKENIQHKEGWINISFEWKGEDVKLELSE